MRTQRRVSRKPYVVDDQSIDESDHQDQTEYVPPQVRHANLTSELKNFREWLQSVNSPSHEQDSDSDLHEEKKQRKTKSKTKAKAKSNENAKPKAKTKKLVDESDPGSESTGTSKSDSEEKESVKGKGKKGSARKRGNKKPPKIINQDAIQSQAQGGAASGFRVGVRF